MILKFIWKNKQMRTAKTLLNKKSKLLGLKHWNTIILNIMCINSLWISRSLKENRKAKNQLCVLILHQPVFLKYFFLLKYLM